jgi:hypothetical protein
VSPSTSAATGSRAPSRRSVATAGLVVLGLLAIALFVGRPAQDGPAFDPRSDASFGTSALAELVRRLGGDVQVSVGLPRAADDVALVFEDRFSEAQREDVLDWVRAGGRLVVAVPGLLTPEPAPWGVFDDELDVVGPGECTIGALTRLAEVEPGGGRRLEVPAGAGYCYGDDEAAFVVAVDEGAGVVVAVGGPGFAVNERLDRRDNAALAAALLVPEPGTSVRFVDPPVPAGEGDKTLLELIPSGIARVVLQLGVAFVLYALWRAVRLGKPVTEHQPVRIAGSELTGAVGRLLARTRSPGAAADLLRADLRRDLAARLGLPPDAGAEQFADAVAARSDTDPEGVLATLSDRPVATDDELVALARTAATIRQEILR